ncbi:MAG: DUF3267 domain-containing protein [Prevotella sp.]|jgi:hypothetical protein
MEPRKVAINIIAANVFAVILFVAAAMFFAVPFFIMQPDWLAKTTSYPNGWLPFIIMIILGIPLHEGIHGLTWALVNKGGFRNVSFGVIWKYLTPYCHYSKPMSRGRYIAGAMMPCLLLGLIPAFVSWLNGNLFWLIFGVIYTSAAAGDIWMTYLILKEPKDALFLDHPSEAGFYVIEK